MLSFSSQDGLTDAASLCPGREQLPACIADNVYLPVSVSAALLGSLFIILFLPSPPSLTHSLSLSLYASLVLLFDFIFVIKHDNSSLLTQSALTSSSLRHFEPFAVLLLGRLAQKHTHTHERENGRIMMSI